MGQVTIRVLGCGDAFGSGGRLQACFLLSADDQRCLIDCGATALVAMRRFDVDPATIDTVILSHLHGDHFGGLPFLLLDGQFASRRRRPLVIAGPPGTRERVMAALDILFPGSAQLDWAFRLRFVELSERRTKKLGGFAVRPYEVEHPSGNTAFALRLQAGERVVAYSGDTAWTEALLDVARDADLFITECYAFDCKRDFHINYRTLESRLPDLHAKRVLLTHMSAAVLGRRDELKLDTAADGQLIEL